MVDTLTQLASLWINRACSHCTDPAAFFTGTFMWGPSELAQNTPRYDPLEILAALTFTCKIS